MFARTSIVEAHPEWINQALDKAPIKTDEVAILEKGGKTFGKWKKSTRTH